MTTLLLATRNPHKMEEIQAILGGQFKLLALDNFIGAPKVVEDAKTFAGNAAKKAVELARWLNQQPTGEQLVDFVLADDSGLEVDALNGAPGVHSARFAALDQNENSPDTDNNAKLLRLLKNIPPEKRTARFRCVLALVSLSGEKSENASPVCYVDGWELLAQQFDGTCEGEIIAEPRGPGGFGYDPLFVPEGFTATFSELGDNVKNQLSHRAKALAKLAAFFAVK